LERTHNFKRKSGSGGMVVVQIMIPGEPPVCAPFAPVNNDVLPCLSGAQRLTEDDPFVIAQSVLAQIPRQVDARLA
jgi:hypothetical protein